MEKFSSIKTLVIKHVGAARQWPEDANEVIFETPVCVSREEYLEILRQWRQEYRVLSAQIRAAKSNRKGGTEEAAHNIYLARCLKVDARTMMNVRSFLKVMARRDRETKMAVAA